MPKYNGKFQKNQSRNKNRLFLAVGIFATVGVLSLLGIALYKMGERSTMEAQKSVLETEVIQQQTEQEATQPAKAIPVTETPSTEPTEATAVPVETTVVYVEETKPTSEPAAPTEQIGTVLRSAGELRIRSGAGTNYSEIGRLKGGDPVTIYEQKTVNGMTWGNIGDGWVSMDYIVFGEDNSVAPQSQKADYFGDWITDDEKLYMNITQYGNGANIRVVNTIADNVDMTWTMYGEFDEHGALRYWNGVRKDHSMGTETLKYSNGEGAIVVSNGLTLSWHESAEGPGEAARFNKAFNYRFPESTPNGSGVQQNPAEQLGMRGFSDNAVCDKVFASFKKKIQGGYSGAEILYHSSSYSDGYVTYDPGRCTYSCSMTAQYCSNIFDMWGTSTSTYFVTAELAEKNGSLVLTKMDIK